MECSLRWKVALSSAALLAHVLLFEVFFADVVRSDCGWLMNNLISWLAHNLHWLEPSVRGIREAVDEIQLAAERTAAKRR